MIRSTCADVDEIGAADAHEPSGEPCLELAERVVGHRRSIARMRVDEPFGGREPDHLAQREEPVAGTLPHEQPRRVRASMTECRSELLERARTPQPSPLERRQPPARAFERLGQAFLPHRLDDVVEGLLIERLEGVFVIRGLKNDERPRFRKMTRDVRARRLQAWQCRAGSRPAPSCAPTPAQPRRLEPRRRSLYPSGRSPRRATPGASAPPPRHLR